MGGRPRDRRDESPDERADRNMGEVLQELRVALPGVQVLFAFLLTVVFATGFDRVDGFGRGVYFACLLGAAVSTGFYIAPAAQHRVLFRSRDKEELLRRSNRYALVASAVLAFAMAAALLLVVDVLFSRQLAWAVAGGCLALLLWLWLLEPLQRLSRQS